MIESINSIGHVVSSYTQTNVTAAKTTVEHIKYILDRGVQRVEVSSYTTYNKQGEVVQHSQQNSQVDILV